MSNEQDITAKKTGVRTCTNIGRKRFVYCHILHQINKLNDEIEQIKQKEQMENSYKIAGIIIINI